jgi:nucleotide-binding universal stress UspA family protein
VSDVVKTLRDSGVTARGEVQGAVAGHAPKHIVETAKSQGSDLIIMGSRGLSNLAGLLLGSVTHKVIQLAQKPVLVVRAPEVEGGQ